MSYTVQFYLVELDKIKNVIGSQNLPLVDEIDVDDEDREYLETLLMGAEQDEYSGSEYGYALEKIIEQMFGESESAPAFEELHFAEFNNPALDWIVLSEPPIKLPPNDDFPFIGHRLLADMQKALDEWDDEKLETLNDREPEIQAMIECMLDVFQTAVEHKKDLITFYY